MFCRRVRMMLAMGDELSRREDLISETYLWFQITVAYSISMQYHQPLHDLPANPNGTRLINQPKFFHECIQISVWNILHSQVDSVLIFIPAEENNEKLRILGCISISPRKSRSNRLRGEIIRFSLVPTLATPAYKRPCST